MRTIRLSLLLSVPTLGSILACSGGGGGGGTPSAPLPTISSFSSSPSSITAGGSTQLTASFSNGTGMVTPGNLPITSGAALSVSPSATTTYTLSVTGAGGATTATTTVTVVAAPQITSFNSDRTQLWLGQSAQLTATFNGGTGVVNPGALSVASGTPVTVSPTANTTYTLTVTNSLNATAHTDLPIPVETQAPAIAAFSAASPMVDAGQSTMLSWTLGGGIPASLTLNGANVLGTSSLPVMPMRRSSYTLQTTSPLGTQSQTALVAARGQDLFAGAYGSEGSRDGLGTEARFTTVWYMVEDAAGNRFMTDSGNHTIRKITPSGQVSTFAGTAGVAGHADGMGTAASFYYPYGLAIDAAGNLYVGDYLNHLIRKITPAGLVTTLAGQQGIAGHLDGTGAGAQFGGTQGMAVDGSGNIYVADERSTTPGSAIRKITPAGVVTTLAGSATTTGHADGTGAAATFGGSLRGLVLDGAGNLYLADVANYTLRKIVLASGAVTTVAGTAGVEGSTDGVGPAAKLNWPCGLALGPGGKIYIADYNAQTIRTFDPGSAVVTSIAGTMDVEGWVDGPAATAQFEGPCAMLVEPNGNLLTSDWDGGAIRLITSAGQVSTLAGLPIAYGATDGLGAAVRFNGLNGIGIAPNGTVYLNDTTNFTIRMMSPGAAVTTFAGSGSRGHADGAPATAKFDYAYSPTIGIDGSGNFFMGDTYNQTIRKITSAGAVSTLAGSPGASGTLDGTGAAANFNNPHGTAVDSLGNIFVADTGNHAIRKVTPAGVVTTFAGQKGVHGTTDGTGLGAQFNGPTGLAFHGTDLYVADFYNHSIRKITSAGVVTTLAGLSGTSGFADGPGGAARFNNPNGLAVDPAGNVFVADNGNNAIRKITPSGTVTTITGSPANNFTLLGAMPSSINHPTSVAITAAGDLLVTVQDGVILITAP